MQIIEPELSLIIYSGRSCLSFNYQLTGKNS